MKKVIFALAFFMMLSGISASVQKSIAFDQSHNLFKIEKAFPMLVNTLKTHGYGIDYSDGLDLEKDVLVLMMPSDEFTRFERKQILDYVRGGGGLLLVCEWGFYADQRHILQGSNSIAKEFGVEFEENLVYDPKNNNVQQEIWAIIKNMRRHPITEGVSSFFYPSGASISLQDVSGRIAWGSQEAWGETDFFGPGIFLSPEECPFIAYPSLYSALKKDRVVQSPDTMEADYGELKHDDLVVLAAFHYGKGKVVFVGDSDVFVQTNPENIRLMLNIFEWLLT